MIDQGISPVRRQQLAFFALALASMFVFSPAHAQDQPAAAPVQDIQASPAGSIDPQTRPSAPDANTPVPSVAPVPRAATDQPGAEPSTTEELNNAEHQGPAQQPSADGLLVPSGGFVAKAKLPHDLSPWSMFLAADIVVKAVMIGLAFASVVTWTVWLAKSMELAWARRRLSLASRTIAAASSLSEAKEAVGDARGIVQGLLSMAGAELRLSAGIDDTSGIKERVASRLDGLTLAAGRNMNRGTGVLATIGSTAPFVGLFGTVWGIMNSFIGISESQTTNLAVVAPGIAEALLATAIGLIAAIPAVIIYNQFARAISSYKASVAEASAEVLRLVSRDLDRGTRPSLAQAAE